MPKESKDDRKPSAKPDAKPQKAERPPVRIPLEPDYITKKEAPPDIEERDKG